VVRGGGLVTPSDELARLAGLSSRARDKGRFTGLLPHHTPTWAGGAAWRAAWPHGPIPPLA
jgi:hypothetical protein